MKILITGGAGFIGSHLVEAYQELAQEIRVLDNLKTGTRKNLEDFRHHFIEGSICDPDIVESAAQGVDLVFHMAALANVPDCLENPVACENVNIRGLMNVLVACEKWNISRVLFPSSASVYGPTPPRPTNEESPLAPDNPYSQSKAYGEFLLSAYFNKASLSCSSLRLFNVYGPRQNPEGGYAAAIPTFIDRASKNEDLFIFGDGEQTRDFVLVDDVVAAFRHLASRKTLVGSFNVGGALPVTIQNLATEIIRLTGSSSRIQFQEARKGDARFSNACSKKLQNTGWVPTFDLQTGLSKTIDSFKQHKQFH